MCEGAGAHAHTGVLVCVRAGAVPLASRVISVPCEQRPYVGVGAGVGVGLGADVGAGVGVELGADVGAGVGVELGAEVGAGVGAEVGADVGVGVGVELGAGVGAEVGVGEAALLGDGVGLHGDDLFRFGAERIGYGRRAFGLHADEARHFLDPAQGV